MKLLQGTKPAAAVAVLMLASFFGTAGAVAKIKEGGASAKKADTSAAKKAKTSSTKFKILPGGSAESPAERASRLRRECKGRVNAGACEGYTS